MTLSVQKIFTILSAISFSLGRTDTSTCPITLPRNAYLKSFRNMCLRFVLTEKDWTDARDDCKKNGNGLLVQVFDADTQLFIVNTLKSLKWNHNGVWIGADDLKEEGTWIWVTGQSLTYSNWQKGYGPEHTGFFSTRYMDDCAQIRLDQGGQWQDKPCNGGPAFHYSFICQYYKISTPAPITMSAKITTELISSAKSKQYTSSELYETSGTSVPTTSEMRATRKGNSVQGKVTMQYTSSEFHETNGTSVPTTSAMRATHKGNSAQGKVTVQYTSSVVNETAGTTVPTITKTKATHKEASVQGHVTVQDQFKKDRNTYSSSSGTARQELSSSNPVTAVWLTTEKIESSTIHDRLETIQPLTYPKTVEKITTDSSLKASGFTFLEILHSKRITSNIHVNSKESSKMLSTNEETSTVRQDITEALNTAKDHSFTTSSMTGRSVTIPHNSKPKDLSLDTLQASKETTSNTMHPKTHFIHKEVLGNDISSTLDSFVEFTTRETFHQKQHLINKESDSTTITLCGTILGGALILTVIGVIIFVRKRRSKIPIEKEDNRQSTVTFENSTYDSLNTDSYQRQLEHDV